ncbi:MAG TPA: hypothetical protein VID95_09605 [Candidatus Limnocylindrales bacterium]|jgi:hypothetical protein
MAGHPARAARRHDGDPLRDRPDRHGAPVRNRRDRHPPHSRFQPADPGYAQTPQGNQIEYTYAVEGVTYPGADFRTWTDVTAHHPKICYEPRDPSNHLLVDGSVRCGIDPGP